MDSDQINQEEAERLLAKLDENGKADFLLQAYAEMARKDVARFCRLNNRWPDCHELHTICAGANSFIFSV